MNISKRLLKIANSLSVVQDIDAVVSSVYTSIFSMLEQAETKHDYRDIISYATEQVEDELMDMGYTGLEVSYVAGKKIKSLIAKQYKEKFGKLLFENKFLGA